MKGYYSFIAGLPDLEFNPQADFMPPAQLAERLSELLSPEEMEWVRLLELPRHHRPVAAFLAAESNSRSVTSVIPAGGGHLGSDSAGRLPAYLQKLVHWRETHRGELSEKEILQKLQQLYFAQLLQSGNPFLQKWGEAELNRLNFLAARRSEKNPDLKKQQLIKGNAYHDLLLEYPTAQKIIHSEFEAAARLEIIAGKTNLLERELEIDRLRWDTIGEINRFEYFTVNVILGYFQQLLLLERWREVFNPERQVDLVLVVEKMMRKNNHSE